MAFVAWAAARQGRDLQPPALLLVALASLVAWMLPADRIVAATSWLLDRDWAPTRLRSACWVGTPAVLMSVGVGAALTLAQAPPTTNGLALLDRVALAAAAGVVGALLGLAGADVRREPDETWAAKRGELINGARAYFAPDQRVPGEW